LDVADALDFGFMKKLSAFTKQLKTDFWLMGEVIHGDYNRWVNPQMLDATTNYECYKGLWSSHNDKNYFEIAYSLNRQFGKEHGIYQGSYLYNFADNHDVDRVASSLHKQMHLYPLYLILLTMPGIPSIYYGSEWGLEGRKTPHSDRPLRPELFLDRMDQQKHRDLRLAITRMIRIRHMSSALKHGTYTQLLVASDHLVFLRQSLDESVIVAVNACRKPVTVHFPLQTDGTRLLDLLNEGEAFSVHHGQAGFEIPACWGRILRIE
jgi:glycosidase